MAKGITVPVVQSGLEASIEAAAKKAGPLSLSATVDPSSFKRLAQPLGRVSGLATEFEKSIAASNARVIAFGASVGIINGVQNAFASLVKTTIDVEKSLTNIAVISGKTTDELQPFSRALFEIAKNTAQSFQTASEAALEFSRQGLGLEETLKRTQDALTLTRFTTLSAAEAVDVLTAAANSFGATGITTSEILNKLVAVDTKFAVSAEDLAKGLSRAGSIAQEVGVNFDELNAIVTIAQERTARGGAVIGNAFKTIFTRIRSDETIQALQSIGIYSFDAEGRLKPVVGLLEELAGKINTLGETKRIEVLEAIASKYNINVLTALVDDLGSTASKFREARDVSAGAQSEAYQRQIELNKTLDAVITRVTNSAAQLADTLGRIGVTDSLKSLLNFFDNILTGINDVIDSEGIGGTIAKGLISGLSGVFFKIGIPLLLAIFVKLTRDIAQFGVESLKTILGINKEVRERQALEQAVVNTLIKDQQVMASILSLSGDRRKQEEYLLSVYNRQLASLQQVQTIAAGVAPALQAAGLSATSGTIKKRAAGGYLPAEEAKDVRRGVGGASPSSKVVEIPNFSFGGGKRGTMVANTSEYIVPNYANGSGTAIFNQDMVKQYGLPPGAKKITASGGFIPASGFVPNFAEAKFNIQNPRKRVAKENESKSVITNIDLDNMLPSAYLTISNNPDTSPVGVFSSLQEAAKQKLQEKLGQPIDPSARVEGENIEIKKIQNSYASGGQLIGSIIDAQRKIQSGKANVKKESEVIVNRIIPETSGPLDDNLRKTLVARVENEIKTANSPFFAAGNILEDVLFASTEGDLQDRNSRSWDLPKNISPNFKKAFNLKSDFADVKLGKTERSMSSFLGKHIMAPSGTNASRGYIPNFARYVYDADRVDADKNNLLKAILASRVKKNLIVGPAGSGKSTYGESLGSFITNIAQLTDASEIDILSGAARTKDGGVSKNFQQISDAVNASGGKISYLYTGNMDILSRRTGRIAEGPKEGDLRSKKQIAGSMFAPLNQFDFISKVKGSAKNFEMIRGARGYVPNFAEDEEDENAGKKTKKVKKIDRKNYLGSRAIVSAEGIAGMLVPDQANQAAMTRYLSDNPWGFQTKEDVYLNDADKSLITNVRYKTYGLKENAFEGERLKKSGTQTLIEADVEKVGVEIAKKWAAKYSDEYAKKMPGAPAKADFDSEFIGRSFIASEGAVSAISTLGGGIFESSIRAALDTQVGQRIEKAKKEDASNRLDFPVNPFIKELFGIDGGEQFVDAKISGNPGSTGRKLADQIVAARLYKPVKTIKTAAADGYIPNFAANEPLKEAISREVAAGIAPARVRVTQDDRLQNSKNPEGLAVINTRDEPNGKIPSNFRKRAARQEVASAGFVPNFAQGVSLKGGTKFTTETQDIMGGAPISAAFPRQELEKLRKVLNEAVAAYEAEIKAGKDVEEAKKKLNEATNKATREANLSKESASKVQSAVAKTAGGVVSGDGKSGKALADSTEKTKVGLDKMFYALSGITTLSYTLQSVFKDSESAVAKFTIGVASAAQTASQFALAGGAIRDLTENLADKGGAFATLGKIGKYAGPAGAILGAGVGIYQAVQENQRKSEEARASDLAKKYQKDVEIELAGLTETEKTAKITKEKEKADTTVSELESRRTVLQNRLNAINRFETARAIGLDMGGANRPEGDEKFIQAELDKTDVQLKDAKTIQKITTEAAKEENDRVQRAARVRQANAIVETANLNERLVLQQQLGKLSEAFSKAENDALLTRVKNRIKINEQVLLGNQYQKDEAALQLKLSGFENQKEDAKSATLEATIKELASMSSLANVDKVALNQLIEKIKANKSLVGLEQEINALKEDGILRAKATLETQTSILDRNLAAIDARKQELALVDASERKSKAILAIEQIISNTISSRIRSIETIRRITEDANAEQANLRRKIPIAELEAQISTQPFATPKQEYDLLLLRKQARIEEETAAIALSARKRQGDQALQLKDKIVSLLPSLEYLDKKTRDGIQTEIERASSIDDTKARLEAFGKIARKISEIPTPTFLDSETEVDLMLSTDGLDRLEGLRREQEKGDKELLSFNEEISRLKKEQEIAEQKGAASEALRLKLIIDRYTYEQKIAEIRARSQSAAGFTRAFDELGKEAEGFTEKLSYETTFAFRDGLRDALGAAISQTDDLNGALQAVAINFLKTLQGKFLNQAADQITLGLGKIDWSSVGQGISNYFKTSGSTSSGMAKGGYVKGYADGGKVIGGSGVRDDVPAMLSAGEYVIRKSAVRKYGENNLKMLNNGGVPKMANGGGFFLPGVRGGTEISGYKDLTAFANQTTTSGATDVLKGSRSSAFINLEDQSQKLSPYALMNEDDIINKEVRSAQEQGLKLIKEREAYRTAQRKALQKEIVGTVLAIAANYGASKLAGPNPNSTAGMRKAGAPDSLAVRSGLAYGGMIKRYNAGGGPTDDIPALLMAGEYVMSRQATNKYGKQFFDSVNQGRAPRFADGGQVPTSESSFAEKAADSSESKAKSAANVNITINVTKGSSTMESQGSTEETDADYKKMSEQIKAIVMNTINEEKRLGGSLRSRG